MMKKKQPFVIGEKQVAAVKMMVDGDYAIQDIAAILGVHRTTVWRWFQHKEMQKYYDRYEAKKCKEALRQWRQAARRADQKEARDLERKLSSRNPWEANAAAVKIMDAFFS